MFAGGLAGGVIEGVFAGGSGMVPIVRAAMLGSMMRLTLVPIIHKENNLIAAMPQIESESSNRGTLNGDVLRKGQYGQPDGL